MIYFFASIGCSCTPEKRFFKVSNSASPTIKILINYILCKINMNLLFLNKGNGLVICCPSQTKFNFTKKR